MGRIVGIPTAALVLSLTGLAAAATVLRFDLHDLTDRAAVVVHGKVVSKEARRDDRVGAIVTDLRLEVIEALKGTRGQSFSFTIFGGVLGDRGSAISGAATFDEGEEVLVFLDQVNQFGLRNTIGLSQGKYTIREVEGRRLAFRDLEGLQLMDSASGEVQAAQPEQGQPFDELLAAVKRRLQEQQGEGKKQ